VQKRQILDICVPADFDFVDIAADHDAGPDTGIITDGDAADHLRGRINVDLLAGLGRERFHKSEYRISKFEESTKFKKAILKIFRI
jgi:hypothetical protein